MVGMSTPVMFFRSALMLVVLVAAVACTRSSASPRALTGDGGLDAAGDGALDALVADVGVDAMIDAAQHVPDATDSGPDASDSPADAGMDAASADAGATDASLVDALVRLDASRAEDDAGDDLGASRIIAPDTWLVVPILVTEALHVSTLSARLSEVEVGTGWRMAVWSNDATSGTSRPATLLCWSSISGAISGWSTLRLSVSRQVDLPPGTYWVGLNVSRRVRLWFASEGAAVTRAAEVGEHPRDNFEVFPEIGLPDPPFAVPELSLIDPAL